MKLPLYQRIAQLFGAYERCRKSGNPYQDDHADKIVQLCENHLPHGSGFDCGTKFDFEASRPNRLVFTTSYHHMNRDGYYDGWTNHAVIVTPNLSFGFDIRVTGRDKNDIKEYIAEVIALDLSEEVDHE